MFKIDTLNHIILDPELLLIPEFKIIWERDSSTEKLEAYKFLKYIFFMCDYKSPYNSYGEDKEKVVIRDFFGDVPVVKSPELLAAMKKYDELKKIPEVHVLEASRDLMFKVSDYMKKVEITGRTFKSACDALANVGKTLASYGQVKESVERELGKQGKSRGDRKRGLRED